jgi:hypothetical protein
MGFEYYLFTHIRFRALVSMLEQLKKIDDLTDQSDQ